MSIKHNLLYLIDKRELSIPMLARKSGLRVSTIQNLIYDRVKNPTISVLQAISKALDCPLSELIADSDDLTLLTDWNAPLFYECIDNTVQSLRKNNTEVSYNTFQNIVRELYLYSSKENEKKMSKEMLYILTKK